MDGLNNTVAHSGPIVMLGGRKFVVPPMTLKVRRLDSESRKAMAAGYDELTEQDLLLQVVGETLKRNYPELDLKALENEIEYAELLETYATIKEQEAKHLAEMGKRLAAAALGSADR